MSTMQLFSVPAGVVNCHWTPVSLALSTAMAGLPPVGAPGPLNGIITVVTVGVTINAACGDVRARIARSLGIDALFVCALSLVAYWAVQPMPSIVPLMSNWTPVWAVASMQAIPSGLPLK